MARNGELCSAADIDERLTALVEKGRDGLHGWHAHALAPSLDFERPAHAPNRLGHELECRSAQQASKSELCLVEGVDKAGPDKAPAESQATVAGQLGQAEHGDVGALGKLAQNVVVKAALACLVHVPPVDASKITKSSV